MYSLNHRILPWILTLLLSTTGCSSLKKSYNFQAGGNWGGIVEDATIDAVTGATSLGLNLGFHTGININRRMLETGVDFLSYNQSFTYLDAAENYNGTRDFKYGELRIPLTYNFQLFRNDEDEGRLQLKGGFSVGYRIYEKITDTGTLPAYTFDKLSIGPSLGISVIPFKITSKLDLGFYLDLVRTAKVYQDHYIIADGTGSMSNLKFGIVLKMR